MKIRDLIKKLNLDIDIFPEVDLDFEVETLTIQTKGENITVRIINEATHKRKYNLETLGYSF